MPGGGLVIARYASVVYVCKFCIKSSGRIERYFLFVGPGVSMGWIFSKTFGCKMVDEVSDGFNIKSVVQTEV
jgi:hypothetical protein